MNRVYRKVIVVFFISVMMIFTLNACKNNTEDTGGEETEAAETAPSFAVTIQVDGKEITIEDTLDKTVLQLLDEADITLNKGDILSIAPDQKFLGEQKVIIQILRRCKVQIVVTDEDSQEEQQYTVVLVGGTVSDAIEAAGITLADNQIVNYELDKALENEMTIIISDEEEDTEEIEESGSQSNNTRRSSTPASDPGGQPAPSPAAPVPEVTEAPEEIPTEAPSTERTIVNKEDYPDCDGSGHGVIVYTYSDGTQEEVTY